MNRFLQSSLALDNNEIIIQMLSYIKTYIHSTIIGTESQNSYMEMCIYYKI